MAVTLSDFKWMDKFESGQSCLISNGQIKLSSIDCNGSATVVCEENQSPIASAPATGKGTSKKPITGGDNKMTSSSFTEDRNSIKTTERVDSSISSFSRPTNSSETTTIREPPGKNFFKTSDNC